MTKHRYTSLLREWPTLGAEQDDTEDLRLKKKVLTIVSASIALLALGWGCLYVYSGYAQAGAIPIGYALLSLASTLHFFRRKRFAAFCFVQQLLVLLFPFLLMWRLGGFANGSVAMIWAFFAPLAALFFIDLKTATRWMLAYLGLLVVSAIFNETFVAHAQPMPAGLNTLYFLMNLGCGYVLIGLMLYYFVKDRESAYARLLRSEAHIREMMLTDPLTGVANRRHLDDRMAMELGRQARYHEPLAVILTDLDNFKHVNDTYGHAVGDAVLKAFAQLLAPSVRATDFVARYGGEEFVLLLPHTSLDEAVALAERMRAATEQIEFPQPGLHLTSSFGVTVARPNEGMAEVLSRADEAMYQSKARGRNRVSVLLE